ncbi:RNA-directed DNA polymerase [Xanthomonas translucens pv. poae]|uniref:RNA-directed DNA polymerase n=1 Tax=Xanthomonas graminis pv. poae TaxID=227946 RepID=A0A0K3A0J9_9XANT|nr:reverse transcriptase domain-containing protein [Xanthomonas translucens]UKE62491.1 RNA-directed DNA polymerase [Xanthomonas translucens pv. poae]CTP91601.1 RNA-directed DNA polymerase [Xanthomonas translucens pv. poae]
MPSSPPVKKNSQQLSDRALEFKAMASRSDLAQWIGIKEKTLLYILYKLSDSEKYKDFTISKRDGGTRLISAPLKALKFSQKRISAILQEISPPRHLAKGYVPGKGIFDHAFLHKHRKTVVTADITNFFPSINFGRVRGMFLSPPFSLPTSLATMLAQLCCKDGQLPQGSPSSPAISNIICRSLDLELLEFSKRHRISVSRYADDICFSTNMRKPIFGLYEINSQFGNFPGTELSDIFTRNGFTLNIKKFKVSKSNSRQMVTGLIVNDRVNIPRAWRRQLRVLLHLRSRMEDAATTKVVNSWSSPLPSRKGETSSIDNLIQGKASFAAYIDRRSGTNHIGGLYRSYPKLRGMLPRVTQTFPVRIISEGPTDLLHLQAALEHYGSKLDLSNISIKFHNYQSDQGDADTLQTLRRIAKVDVEELTIGIFDYDNPKLLRDLSLDAGGYVRLGRMVFAACLARPAQTNGMYYCIESLYRRDQASRTTTEGRRLFFADEFKEDGSSQDGSLRREHPKKSALVLSERVFDPAKPEVSLTLSKTDFASMVFTKAAPFSDMDFSGFLPTLTLLRRMVDEAMRYQGIK